jgi:excinuclease ABC subunit C
MSQHNFHELLKACPTRPGVYIFKDVNGNPLYVGKAFNLRNRLRTYFTSSGNLPMKINRMMEKVVDFEYILTESEREALILECNLIKQLQPQYNARLKDDKNYPYIKIDLSEEFPQVYFTRRVLSDGARYFGPFANAGSIRKTMNLLNKLFPYRSCTKPITGMDARPCLEYYIHRCVAPCIGAVNRQEYREVVEEVILFLEGNTERVVKNLESKMKEASQRLEFESAARLRDQIKAIQTVNERQKVLSLTPQDKDIIALAMGRDLAWVEIFFIRYGKLIGRDHFIMYGTDGDEPADILKDFLKQFYASAPYVPKQIILEYTPGDSLVIQDWLRQKRGGPVKLSVPIRGQSRRLLEMVSENAVQGLDQLRIKWLSDVHALDTAMSELQEELNLPRSPRRIECYDISNTQGSNPVGSMVVFQDAKPKNSHYRRFKIKNVKGIDDYAMMQEMLRRRFGRLTSLHITGKENNSPTSESNATWGILPDMVLIDGGKGHLSSAQEVFLELGLDYVPLASIAKEREEIFIPHNPHPIMLPRNSQGLYLLQRVRDEAHRFAITFHRQRRSKATMVSAMDLVPGIGPKRKKGLLRKFGSVRAIREAPVEDLAAVPSMTMYLAQALKEHL